MISSAVGSGAAARGAASETASNTPASRASNLRMVPPFRCRIDGLAPAGGYYVEEGEGFTDLRSCERIDDLQKVEAPEVAIGGVQGGNVVLTQEGGEPGVRHVVRARG